LVVKLVALKVADIESVILLKPVVADVVDFCHWILPVYPLKVNVVLFVPVHTLTLPPLKDPPTDAGLTVTVALALLAESHTPLLIIAL